MMTVSNHEASTALEISRKAFDESNIAAGMVRVDDSYLVAMENPAAIEIILDDLANRSEAMGYPFIFQVCRDVVEGTNYIRWTIPNES